MMYSKSDIIEMETSFNCYVLSSNVSEFYSVDIYRNDKNERFTQLDKKNIFLNVFKILHLKNYICNMKEVSGPHKNKVKFWKVNVEEKKIKDDNISTEDDIVQRLSGEVMKDQVLFSSCFKDELANHNNIIAENVHIITIIPTTATGQKRYASESVDTEPKRKRDTPTFESLIADLEENIPLDRPPELYPIPNIAGRFHKKDIPISGNKYVDMRLDVETTDTGRKLINKFKDETKACYLLYAVSGAGKTRAIFDMSMNENGIYVVYVECRPSSDFSNRNYEPTMDRNFAQLVSSIGAAFGSYNDAINISAREEAKRLIILEFTARILYLILLKKKFPDITPRDYLLSQLNGGQECIASIRDSLTPIGCTLNELQIIIRYALRYLKDKLTGQQSLIFAIDESNVASNKLFNGYFLNVNNHPRGLLTPMIEILRLFEISIVIAGTAFTLKQGNDINSDIGKLHKTEYIINFNTIDSKDVEAYIMRYLDLSDCEIDKIENSKYLVGRPRLVARLVTEIINAEEDSQENKQTVLECAVNKTVQSIKADMIDHLEVIVNKAYEKKGLGNVELRKILMTLFINCWFFDGYVSKSEINDDSAELVDCGIASLKPDKDKKFWQVKEPLAIDVVKIVLHSRYSKPTEPLLNKLIEELEQSAAHLDKSNTSKGIVWQYLVIARLMDFNNKTVFDFVNEIYDNQSLPEWTKKATIDIKSYGNLQTFLLLDNTLEDDVDVIKNLLYNTSTFSGYMLVPGQFMRPDGVYIGKQDVNTYWTLLISAKMFTDKLLGKGVEQDKRSTNWDFMYYQKVGGVNKRQEPMKQKLDEVRNKFTHQGSLRIHYILPGITQERGASYQSNRGGCYIESNDVIMYIDEELLKRYFPTDYVVSLKRILKHN